MNDRQLIQVFESLTVTPDSFHHSDHVHLVFAYLREYPALAALEKFTNALKRFAAFSDKPQLYNETITYAYFFLIHERMVRSKFRTWEEFARGNPDLLEGKNGILSRYYRDATLKSDLAKKVFILPDKYLERARNNEVL
jgi:hypothetical protein